MTKQMWNDKVKVKEIVAHLLEYHAIPFKDSNLTEEQFIDEHFVGTVSLQGRMTEQKIQILKKIHGRLKSVLRFCEKNRVPLVRVLDQNRKGDFEWRICKPSQSQVSSLRNLRWFPSAEGLFNKATLQQAMLDKNLDVDELLDELRDLIAIRQNDREKERKAAEQKMAEKIADVARKDVKEAGKKAKKAMKYKNMGRWK